MLHSFLLIMSLNLKFSLVFIIVFLCLLSIVKLLKSIKDYLISLILATTNSTI
jgi:hypothetical protein